MDNNFNNSNLNHPSASHPSLDVDRFSSYSFCFQSDYLDSLTPPYCFYGDDQMNFVTNLFQSSEEYAHEESDSISHLFRGATIRFSESSDVEDHSNYVEELGLGFTDEFDTVTLDSHTIQHSNLNAQGLRIVGIDSDSDTESVHDNEANSHNNSVSDNFGTGVFVNEEVEVDNREVSSSVIDRIEEIPYSSGTCSEDEDDVVEESQRDLEWEILLAVNNLNGNTIMGNISDDIFYLELEDDSFYDAEYDSMFGQILESATSLKISPPAAKSVVESLPCVVLTKEDLEDNNVACAVCKDEIVADEKVTQLPCCHHYHRDCILPWLRSRNTCPVCRFELPTDNVNYEQLKTEEGDLRILDDLQV